MTPDERLMLAEQGAADPELMGATVSAEIKSPEARRAMATAAASPAEAMRDACRNIASKWQSIAVQRSCGVAVGLCADSIIRDINEIPLPADPRDAEIVRGLSLPAQMDDDLQFILGRPNFTCGIMADIMRRRGHEIPRKSEAEQAAVIFWMLGHYHRAGSAWRDPADAEIKRWQEDARAALAQSGTPS